MKRVFAAFLAAVMLSGCAGNAAPTQAPVEETTAQTTVETTQAPETTAETTAAPEETTEPQKVMAPDFTVYDLEGNAHSLSDFRGKPVILNFWATWCGFCVQEMPEFQEVFEEYGTDIHFLMVNVTDGQSETVDKASAFLAEKGYTFPVYYDTELSATYAYGVNAMPVTYFIDAEGGAVAMGEGALDKTTLLRGVQMLLEG